MTKGLKTNFIIASAGVGFTVGALATVLSLPTLVLLAVGLGVMMGATFRALAILSDRLARIAADGDEDGMSDSSETR